MNMRELIKVISEEMTSPSSKEKERHELLGSELKKTLSKVNLDKISDETLGEIVVNLIEYVDDHDNRSREDVISDLYRQDDREDELEIAKRLAEIRRIDAQTAMITAGQSLKN